INEDGSVTVNVTVGDAQTPVNALTLSASTNNNALFPNGSVTFGGSGANRTITLTPAANAFGTAIVSYVVTDGGGMSVTKTFTVTVNSVNDAPVFSATQGTLSLTQNVTMTSATAPIATDADTPSLTYSMTGLPTGLSFDPATRAITGTPTVTGTFTVTYSVTDGTSTVTQSFQTVVAAAHVPPIMGDVPNQTGSTGTAFNLNLSSYVTATNGDAILGYAVASGSLPPGLTLNTATGAITGTPTTAGTFGITVLAYDTDGNSNADSVAFSIADATAPNVPTVTAGYPSITSANSVTVEVNGEVGSTVWVNGTSTGVTIGGTGKANVNLDTSGADGAKNFAITLKDSSNNQSLSASVSITADRTAPTTVSSSASGVADTAATLSFTVNEAATGYYLVLPSASPAPSAATVLSTGTSLSLSANSAQSVSLTGLSQTTSYVAYFVAKDTLNNAQAAVSTVSFTTLATPDVTPPNNPTITAGYATSTSANSVAVEVNGEVGATVGVNGSNTGSVV
ncbi:MAG: putative Ig domain-containing protein, partial [Patescibacteria group bacterium]